jgi:dihydroorotate dehydrogenase
VTFGYRLARPVLAALPPELAHQIALTALAAGLAGRAPADEPILAISALGLAFTSPIGLAAGFDKNAVAVPALLAAGFAFVEVGAVTPLPQAGSPRPRLFRWREGGAIVNRMGFNNEGLAAVVGRLGRISTRAGPIGINLGKNRDTADAAADYAAGVAAASAVADFLVINVSSPNTPGLRGLQAREALAPILAAALAARRAAPRRPPLLVKIAPDLGEGEAEALAEAVAEAGIEGMVIANTTTARPTDMPARIAAEAGGLSGRPLMGPATRLLARIARTARGRLVLIGVGGVSSGADAYEKIRAGASLVQLYTAFAYHGPPRIAAIKRDLAARLRADGFSSVSEAVGSGLS